VLTLCIVLASEYVRMGRAVDLDRQPVSLVVSVEVIAPVGSTQDGLTARFGKARALSELRVVVFGNGLDTARRVGYSFSDEASSSLAQSNLEGVEQVLRADEPLTDSSQDDASGEAVVVRPRSRVNDRSRDRRPSR
jgi:hypothetical protein